MDSTRVRERLYSRTVIDLDEPRTVNEAQCWHWTGGKTKGGYGQFSVGSQKGILAHRAAYELAYGPIPAGLTVDHMCHVPEECSLVNDCPHRSCVNPAHLEAVPPRQNVLRGGTVAAANAAKTECDSGHEFDEANTYFGADGHRECRQCAREKMRRVYAARKAAEDPDAPCSNGHPRTPENSFAASNGSRGCRECKREGTRRSWEARRAAKSQGAA